MSYNENKEIKEENQISTNSDLFEKETRVNENLNKQNDGFNNYVKVNEYNNYKDKMQRRFVCLLAFTIIFAVGFMLFGILYTESNLARNSYGNTLEASYQRAVYDLTDNVNNIEVNLSKAQVSNDDSLQRKYLQLICDNCKYAQSNFQILPVALSTTREGVSFINKMDGYCTSLISSETTLTQEQKEKLAELYDITLELKVALNNLIEKIINGYSILQGMEEDAGDLDDFSANFEGLGADSISYPSMIFDGPFSDSLYNREIKGLTEIEVDMATAQNNLASILDENYDYEEIIYEGEANGDFATYDFTINLTDGGMLSASLAKRGGFLITLSGYVLESETTEFTIEECIDNAISFANLSGASNMNAVWTDAQKGVAFINLAPVINDIIYYPDLVKVKVDMTTGLVLGYDAQSYAYNHIDRVNVTPTLDAVQARDLLDLTLNINTQRLCIIPLEYGGEVLAYEFYCEYYGNEYYIYINAFDGTEERVMKVVTTTDEGVLTK